MSSPIVIEEITEIPSVTARVMPGRDGGFAVRVNQALALKLMLRHRVRHHVDVRSKLPPTNPEEQLSKEEQLLRAIFGEAPKDPPEGGEVVAPLAVLRRGDRLIWHREGEVRFLDADLAVVEEVRREKQGLPKGIGERIVVVAGWDGPLRVGDVLYKGDAAIGVVEAIDDDGTREPHVFFGAGGGTLELTRRLPTALQSAEARSIGPYSLVSLNPITGQRIRPGQLAWLAEHGCRAIAGEFATYKTCDPISRVRVYEAIVKGDPVKDPWSEIRPAPAAPAPPALPAEPGSIFNFFERPKDRNFTNDQLATLNTELRVMGYALALDGHDLRISLSMPGDATAWTFGEVKKPETLNYRTLKPERDGLFCQKIFGPVRDYECQCGKYKRMKHRGIVCESCGVEVIQSRVRRERIGHVRLPSPVVPRHLRRIVSALLNERPKQWLETIDQDGGESLRARLAAVDPMASARALPTGHRDRALLEAFAATGVPPVQLLWSVVPVLPPDLRPLVPLAGGRFATSDLNDLYRRVINRSNRTHRLIELKAPPMILINERRLLRQAVDQLFFNGAKGLPVVKYQGRKLRSLFSLVKRKFQMEPAGVRSDYTGAATALVEDRPRVVIPLAMLYEIAKPMLYCLCEQLGHVTTIKGAKTLLMENESLRRELVARVFASHPMLLGNALLGDALTAAEVELGEDPVIRIPPAVAARIEVRTGSRVVIHLPLSAAGIEEARMLARGEVRSTPVRREGWIAQIGSLRKGAADRLLELAVQGAEDPCETPHAAYLVGGWQLTS